MSYSYYRPQTKLWEGYVFTGIRDSVCRGGHAWLPGGVHGCQGGHSWLQGVCVVAGDVHGCGGACMVVGGGHAWLQRGMHGCGGHAWLRGCMCGCGGCAVLPGGMCGCQGGMCRIRWNTVNEQAVHIILECILVANLWWVYTDRDQVWHRNRELNG